MTFNQTHEPLRVLVAGGGVAGLETIMALRELAGARVAVTLLSPAADFVYQPLSVREPFADGAPDRYPLAGIAADFDVELRVDELDWVAPGQHAAFLKSGAEVSYDVLVVALGARRVEFFERVTTFTGEHDSEAVHGIVQDVEAGYTRRVAFVVPPGVTWPVPLYELALQTAERAREMGVEPELTLITPEETPLAVFGAVGSADVAATLDAAGIALETSAYGEVHGGRLVTIRPSGKVIEADRVVAVPVLAGTAPRGIPADADGFIPVDLHGRVKGIADVYAAGDGVQFPIKQGGIATQQADAVAEVIAKRAGAPIEPRAFRPVMRGKLLTGGEDRFLRAEVSRGPGAASEASGQALWWPPEKMAGRYLSPYLVERAAAAAAAPS
jgi:sulfide:quinone oxidoreductase